MDALAETFETHRAHLAAVAGRMLGPTGEVDDALQETWIRLQRTDVAAVENLAGWLTTVVARVSLSMLRARRVRPEPVETGQVSEVGPVDPAADPEGDAVAADAVGTALLVVLDTLTPAERLAFVLHDLFAVPFEEIAPIVERTPAAARQLASRARRRVRGGEHEDSDSYGEHDTDRRRAVVEAFLAASREGRFADLLAVLDPDVVLRADRVAVAHAATYARQGAPGVAAEVCGADAVARVFAGKARAARPALVDGLAGAAYAPGGRPFSVFRLTIVGGRIVGVEVVADPERIAAMDVRLL